MIEIYHAQKTSSPAKPVARQGRKATDPDLQKQDRRVTNEPGELNSYRYLQVLFLTQKKGNIMRDFIFKRWSHQISKLLPVQIILPLESTHMCNLFFQN